LKGGRGDTGVDLRYHTRKEFKQLTLVQRKELSQWRATELKKKGFDVPSPRGKRGSRNGQSNTNVSDVAVNSKNFSAQLSQANAELVNNIKSIFTEPNEDQAMAAAVTAGIEALKKKV
jgi:hypothetical protein